MDDAMNDDTMDDTMDDTKDATDQNPRSEGMPFGPPTGARFRCPLHGTPGNKRPVGAHVSPLAARRSDVHGAVVEAALVPRRLHVGRVGRVGDRVRSEDDQPERRVAAAAEEPLRPVVAIVEEQLHDPRLAPPVVPG